MKLKIRYENEFQTIELDAKATDEMWVSLSLDCDDNMTQEEKEQAIQNAWDKQYNRPDYINWHKFNRHRGFTRKKLDEKINAVDEFEPLIEEVRDPSVYYEQEIDRSNQWEYEALCQKFVKL